MEENPEVRYRKCLRATGGVIIDGIDNCNQVLKMPIPPGDDITSGFITRGTAFRSINGTVPMFLRIFQSDAEPERWVNAHWAGDAKG